MQQLPNSSNKDPFGSQPDRSIPIESPETQIIAGRKYTHASPTTQKENINNQAQKNLSQKNETNSLTNTPIKKRSRGILEEQPKKLIKLASSSEIKPIQEHDQLCKSIANRFMETRPVTMAELDKYYETLFSGFHENESNKRAENPNDICAVVKSLYVCLSEVRNKSLSSLIDNPAQYDKQLGESYDHLSQVFSLPTNAPQKKWLCKLLPNNEKKACTSLTTIEKFHRELAADLVNVHGKFPIPKTALLEIADKNNRKYQVSVHEYVTGKFGLLSMEKDNCLYDSDEIEEDDLDEDQQDINEEDQQDINSEDDYLPIDKDSFHTLLLFDLLFSNADRHENNLIFQKGVSGIHRVVGIDHGDCMLYSPSDRIKLNYLAQKAFDHKFSAETLELIGSQHSGAYTSIMHRLGIQPRAIEWTNFVCSCVSTLCEEVPELSAREVASLLTALHQNQKWNVALLQPLCDMIKTNVSEAKLEENDFLNMLKHL